MCRSRYDFVGLNLNWISSRLIAFLNMSPTKEPSPEKRNLRKAIASRIEGLLVFRSVNQLQKTSSEISFSKSYNLYRFSACRAPGEDVVSHYLFSGKRNTCREAGASNTMHSMLLSKVYTKLFLIQLFSRRSDTTIKH